MNQVREALWRKLSWDAKHAVDVWRYTMQARLSVEAAKRLAEWQAACVNLKQSMAEAQMEALQQTHHVEGLAGELLRAGETLHYTRSIHTLVHIKQATTLMECMLVRRCWSCFKGCYRTMLLERIALYERRLALKLFQHRMQTVLLQSFLNAISTWRQQTHASNGIQKAQFRALRLMDDHARHTHAHSQSNSLAVWKQQGKAASVLASRHKAALQLFESNLRRVLLHSELNSMVIWKMAFRRLQLRMERQGTALKMFETRFRSVLLNSSFNSIVGWRQQSRARIHHLREQRAALRMFESSLCAVLLKSQLNAMVSWRQTYRQNRLRIEKRREALKLFNQLRNGVVHQSCVNCLSTWKYHLATASAFREKQNTAMRLFANRIRAVNYQGQLNAIGVWQQAGRDAVARDRFRGVAVSLLRGCLLRHARRSLSSALDGLAMGVRKFRDKQWQRTLVLKVRIMGQRMGVRLEKETALKEASLREEREGKQKVAMQQLQRALGRLVKEVFQRSLLAWRFQLQEANEKGKATQRILASAAQRWHSSAMESERLTIERSKTRCVRHMLQGTFQAKVTAAEDKFQQWSERERAAIGSEHTKVEEYEQEVITFVRSHRRGIALKIVAHALAGREGHWGGKVWAAFSRWWRAASQEALASKVESAVFELTLTGGARPEGRNLLRGYCKGHDGLAKRLKLACEDVLQVKARDKSLRYELDQRKHASAVLLCLLTYYADAVGRRTVRCLLGVWRSQTEQSRAFSLEERICLLGEDGYQIRIRGKMYAGRRVVGLARRHEMANRVGNWRRNLTDELLIAAHEVFYAM